MKIKEIPASEQPRELLKTYGVENLSNSDLLSIILRTGVKDINVREVSLNILKEVGSINNLDNMGVRELSKIKGVGNVKALSILAAIELGKRVSSKSIYPSMPLTNSQKIFDAFKRIYINIKQEKLTAIYLDTKKCLISYKTIFIGTIDKVMIHPREIFNEAIKVSASSIVLIHNHPSSSLLPSTEDIVMTNKIKQSGTMLGIPLLDHIITDGNDYYSFYEEEVKNR